jgi:hypothetical protein
MDDDNGAGKARFLNNFLDQASGTVNFGIYQRMLQYGLHLELMIWIYQK